MHVSILDFQFFWLGGAASGAGGGTTYAALQNADAAWLKLRTMKVTLQKLAKGLVENNSTLLCLICPNDIVKAS